MMKRVTATILICLLLSGLCSAGAASPGPGDSGAAVREAVSYARSVSPGLSDPLTGDALAALLDQLWQSDAGVSGEDAVTRGAFCGILAKLLTASGKVLPPSPSETPVFSDVSAANAADADAIAQLAAADIVGGYADGSFRPQEPVTASEAAVALARLKTLAVTDARHAAAPASSVTEGEPADGSWFDDVCVIGHSHAVGMSLTLGIDSIDYYAVSGMSAVDILGCGDFSLPDGSAGTLRQGLSMKSYGKVYLILGTNDMPGGYANLPRFRQSMRDVIDTVQELQLGAEIYLLAIAPVGRVYCDYSPNFRMEYVTAYNRVLKTLSRDYGIAYLDVFTPLSTSDGYMREDIARSDGLHFTADGYALIKDYILTHAS